MATHINAADVCPRPTVVELCFVFVRAVKRRLLSFSEKKERTPQTLHLDSDGLLRPAALRSRLLLCAQRRVSGLTFHPLLAASTTFTRFAQLYAREGFRDLHGASLQVAFVGAFILPLNLVQLVDLTRRGGL